MIESDEKLTLDDLKTMIEEQLERIERGEIIEIDPVVRELVREAVKNLPENVINDNHNESQSGSQHDDAPSYRRTFGDCASALTDIGNEIVGNNGGGKGSNQQFVNNIEGDNNKIIVVNN